MLTTAAAIDSFAGHPAQSLRCGDLGIEIPKGHVGPVLLSSTGRTVWWTGRVAIGLRYEPPHYAEPPSRSALRLQEALLTRA